MKNNKIYGAWYFVTIIEIIISMQFVELTTIDIVLRVALILSGAACIFFGWINILKWLSTGILVLTCMGVIGMFNKTYKDELELKKHDLTLELQAEPKLDLSSCKEFGNNWSCIKGLKDSHKEIISEVRKENKLVNQRIQTLEIELPLSKTIPIFLYAILASVFSFAAIRAANVQVSSSRAQESDTNQIKKIEPKKLTVEQVQNILAQKKAGVSDAKLAKLYQYQSRETFARNYKRLAQEYNLGDQKRDQSKIELKLVRGKVSA